MTTASGIEILQGVQLRYGADNPVILTCENQIKLPARGLTFLIGRNGEGKTTLLRYLSGTLPRAAGPGFSTVYLPEELGFGENMTGAIIGWCSLDRKHRDRFREIAGELELDLDEDANALSKGNRQKLRLALSLSRAEQIGAKVLLLDEPFCGFDYVAAAEAWELIGAQSRVRQVIMSIHPERIRVTSSDLLVVWQGNLTHQASRIEKGEQLTAILERRAAPAQSERELVAAGGAR